MNKKSTIPRVFLRRPGLPGILLFLLSFIHGASAQVSLPDNKPVPYVNTQTPPVSHVTGSSWTTPAPIIALGVVVNPGGVEDPGNAYDSNLSNYASVVPPTLVGGTQRITIDIGQHVTASSANPYFVGFDIMNIDILSLNLSLLGNIGFSIKLYDGTNQVGPAYTLDKDAIAGLLGTDLAGGAVKARIGSTIAPATQITFDRVMFEQVSPLISMGNTRLYNLVLGKYVPADYSSLDCNTNNYLGAPDYPIGVISARTSTSGVTNPYGALDDDGGTTTDIGGLKELLAAPVNYSVGDVFGNSINTNGTTTFVGFDLENSNLLGLLNASLLSNYTISLFNDGAPVSGGSFSGGDLLATNLTLLAESGRTTLGFITDETFDEVRLTIGSTLSTNPTKVHGLVVKPFCAATGGDVLACNTLTPLANPAHPLYINGLRTGNGGVANLGTIVNTENIIGVSGHATITTLAGIAGSSSVSVANALETYPAGSFAGFEVESSSLLQASVLGRSGIKIEVYDRSSPTPDDPVYTSSGNVLAGVGALSGTNTNIIGIISPVAFDEVRLVIDQTVQATVGNYLIHGVYFQKACDMPVDCSFAGVLSQDTHGAVVNADRTGVTLAVNASLGAEALEDPWNAVSASTSDFASLNALAGVLSESSLSVGATAFTFPRGTFAGFEVSKDGGLLDLGALNDDRIIITIYNNGTEVESKSTAGSGLLTLSLLAGSSSRSVIGFYAPGEFDEVRITLDRTVAVETGFSLNVYGAVVSTQYVYETAGLQCRLNYIRPDQNTGYINTPIPGSTATNDDLPGGGTYTSTGTPSVPSGADYTFNINPDGTYTFETDTPGEYTFNIEVCSADLPGACPVVPLKIHVLDRGVVNPPVGYRDYAVVAENSSNNIIPVKANDIPGNAGGTLGNPTLGTGPSHGSVTFNGNGEAVYTPANGFTGTDTFTYTICETPGGLCSSPVTVTVYVQDITSGNTTLAVDDQFTGPMNTPISGNILENDFDAEGHTQSVALIDLNGDGVPETAPDGSPQDVLQGGTKVGTITVNATTGDIVFTPETGFTGTVNVATRIQDSEGATSESTLVLIVKETPDLRPIASFGTNGTDFSQDDERDFVVNLWELNNKPAYSAEAPIVLLISKTSSFDITVPGITLSPTDQPGVSGVSSTGTSVNNENGNWLFRESANFIFATSKAGVNISGNSRAILGFAIKRKAATANGVQNIVYRVQNGSGGEVRTNNNTHIISVSKN